MCYWQILAVTAWLTTAGVAAGQRTVVYFNDFEQPVGREWAAPPIEDTDDRRDDDEAADRAGLTIPPTTKAAGADERFLGEFNNHAVRLTVSDLPPHNRLRLAFNLITIRSWDGSTSAKPGTTTKIGPDQFSVKITGDRTLFSGTFCNHTEHGAGWQQTYPGVLPQDVYPAGAGAVAQNVFGYSGPAETTDAVYYLDMTIPHDAPAVQFVFAAEGLQNIRDESWAIDNVTVEVFNVEDQPPLDDAMLEALWADLAGDNGKAAFAATWLVIAEGERLLPRLKAALADDPVEDRAELQATVAALVADLDGEDYYKARDARKALAELGPEAVPVMREQLKIVRTREARLALAKLLTGEPLDPLADPVKLRRARLVYALRMMDSDKAEAMIKRIEQ